MFYGWYIVGATCLISFYFSGTLYLGFTAVFEPIAREFGWSYAKVSFAASLRGFETGLFVPAIGILMDRLGPRKIIFIGSVMSGIGMMLLSKINSLVTFYASFILITTGLSTATTPLLMAIVGNWFSRNSGLAVGITSSGVALGGILLPLITYIIDSFGWRQAMMIIGIGMWAIPLPLSLVLRRRPDRYGSVRNAENRVSTETYPGTSTDSNPAAKVGPGWVLSSRVFWIISIAFLCQVLTVSAVMTHIMPYLGSIGMRRSRSSVVASILPMLTIIGRVGIGWIGDAFDKKALTFVCYLLSAMGVFLLAFLGGAGLWLTVAFVIIFGIGWGGGVPMLTGLLRDHFGRDRLATIIGFAGGVMTVGNMCGPLLPGWVFDRWGYYRPAWLGLPAVAGLSAIFFYWASGVRQGKTCQ